MTSIDPSPFPAELEGEFWREYSSRSIPVIRVAAALELAIAAAFMVRGLLVAKDPRVTVLIFLLVQLPGIGLWFGATFLPGAARWLHRATFISQVPLLCLILALFARFAPEAALFHLPAAAMLMTLTLYCAIRLPFRWACAAGWTLFAVFAASMGRLSALAASGPAAPLLYLSSANLVGMYVAYVFEAAVRRDFLARRDIATEKDRSERLLLNVLPKPIAERLKAGEKPIADDLGDVSILFADIVGYTVLSGRLKAPELVALLDDIFLRFDALVERHGAEKIKTIGDAYMAVAGLDGRADHAHAAAALGLAMLSELRAVNSRHGLALDVRVGVHSGPVIAGVIGSKKFSYDLWGDTVNVASRMESHGVPGRVHLSQATVDRLGRAWPLERRGPLDIKGKGPMTTYLLA